MAEKEPSEERDVHAGPQRARDGSRSDGVAGPLRQAARPSRPTDPQDMDFGDAHTPTGATSTSDPHHETDPQVDPRQANPHESDKRK